MLQAAQAAYTEDLGAGHAKASKPQSQTPPPVASSSKKPPPPKPTSKFDNYTTAESLGYTDPDLERALAEAERRRTQGVVGDWEVVATVERPKAESAEASAEKRGDGGVPEEVKTEGGVVGAEGEGSRKRPAEAPLEDEEDGRGWKLRKKTVGPGLGEIYDPGVIPIKLKPKKEENGGAASLIPMRILGAGVVGAAAGSSGTMPQASAKPTWAPTKWKKAGEEEETHESTSVTQAVGADSNRPDGVEQESGEPSALPEVKQEESSVGVKLEGDGPPPEPPSGGSLFKKRRAPVGGGAGSRGRRF